MHDVMHHSPAMFVAGNDYAQTIGAKRFAVSVIGQDGGLCLEIRVDFTHGNDDLITVTAGDKQIMPQIARLAPGSTTKPACSTNHQSATPL